MKKDRQTDKKQQIDTHTNRQIRKTDKQIKERQTNRLKKDRQTDDRKTDRKTDSQSKKKHYGNKNILIIFG